jgi:hypothetical protein
MVTEAEIRYAYDKIRQLDNTIPDEVLELMVNAALEKLKEGTMLCPKKDCDEYEVCSHATLHNHNEECDVATKLCPACIKKIGRDGE